MRPRRRRLRREAGRSSVYVRAKQQGGRVYHYLVATERVGNRVKQKTIAYLGEHPTVKAALESLPKEIEKAKEEARGEATRRRGEVWKASRVKFPIHVTALRKKGGHNMLRLPISRFASFVLLWARE